MMIRTIHQKVIVGDKQYQFLVDPSEPNTFIGTVPDEVGKILLSILRRPNEYVNITMVEEKKTEVPTKKKEK